jgi:hypothetical protein
MQIRIVVGAEHPQSETLAIRIIERALRYLDYPVDVVGPHLDPTPDEMTGLVADARSAGINFRIY